MLEKLYNYGSEIIGGMLMSRKKRSKGLFKWVVTLFALLGIFVGAQSSLSPNLEQVWSNLITRVSGTVDGEASSLITPSEDQARSVLTNQVEQQLGDQITWNGHGAFIINHNQTNLNASVASAPYAVNRYDSAGRSWQGDAWLNRTTRQYRNRQQTGNGATNWRPAGFLQATNLTGGPSHAYDRGHLLGYALVGGLSNFDASESNPANIATQTAWANESRAKNSTGQNYYEGLVRQALDRNKQVRYRVTDLYDGDSIVPSGAHIEAKSSDGSLEFNVFVPNVQNNITVNYATGAVTKN